MEAHEDDPLRKMLAESDYNAWYKYKLIRDANRHHVLKPTTLQAIVDVIPVADIPELILSYLPDTDVSIAGELFVLLVTDKHKVFFSGSHIDPREWYGGLIEEYSEIPDEYAETIFQYVLNGFDCLDPPIKVYIFGRVEYQIPQDWHVKLVSKLVHAGVQVCDGGTTSLEHPNLFGSGRTEDGRLEKRNNLNYQNF